MPSPTQPLTTWVLISILATAFTVGAPLLIAMLSYRRAAREGHEKDTAALVTPLIAALLKVHNEERYAHPDTLSRYATLETVNAALTALRSEIVSVRALFDASLATLRTEIGFVRTMIEANEKQRKNDVESFRDDMEQLKKNVARAVGKKDDEL